MSDPRFTQEDLYGRSGRPKASDIRQDDINDCYFLAPLGGLARAQPQRFQDAIRYDSESQTFQVTLYKSGASGPEPVVLTVDQDDIADNLSRKGGSTVDNRRGRDGPIWPAVMETAYAELQEQGSRDSNYAAIDMGHPSDALFALTGDPGENLDPAAMAALGPKGAYERMNNALAEGRPVTVGTFPEPPGSAQDGLMEPHMYMVEGVRRRGDDILLDLRNPYAHNRALEGRDTNRASMTITLESVTREDMPGLYVNIGPAAQLTREKSMPSHESGHAAPPASGPSEGLPSTGNRHVDALLSSLGDPVKLKQAMQSLYDSPGGQTIRAENRANYEAQAQSEAPSAPQPEAQSPQVAAPLMRR
ncbi:MULTISPECIES: C2 family cysteine protease [unclassified Lysobacter]|nr:MULTISPECIES: C2 family cysteine protease [unclassified Lysobacter]MBT2751913.1 hypothetical protein [Lysobacter sp. ISL-50]MBT2777878.1 hypothetical protein [Lysobacter sp. ISL-54]MBT2783134.1 hypothetical protein [Lysobacter sp. ISL-52]